MADCPVLLLKVVSDHEFLIDLEVPEGDSPTGPFTINRQDLVSEIVFPSRPEFGWKRIIMGRCTKKASR